MFRFEKARASESGDYYQVLFENDGRKGREYLLFQGDLEDPDGQYYIETHDRSPSGHFRIARARLRPGRLFLECEQGPKLEVTFPEGDYPKIRRVLGIILPGLEIEESETC